MPMVWQEPALAFKAGDVEVYHTYKNGCADYRQTFTFTLLSCYDDPECGEPCIFDIRDLPEYQEGMDYGEIVTRAFLAGSLPHPSELE